MFLYYTIIMVFFFKIDLSSVVTTFATLLVILEEEIFQSADFQSQSSVYLG